MHPPIGCRPAFDSLATKFNIKSNCNIDINEPLAVTPLRASRIIIIVCIELAELIPESLPPLPVSLSLSLIEPPDKDKRLDCSGTSFREGVAGANPHTMG